MATDLYIADVGQNAFEEIHVVTISDAGANLGWNRMEGLHCFKPRSGCDQNGLVMPIHEYAHPEGCSITGGYVYRGKAIPEIAGRYFFGDFCSGAIYALRYTDGRAQDVVDLSDGLGNPRRSTPSGWTATARSMSSSATGACEKSCARRARSGLAARCRRSPPELCRHLSGYPLRRSADSCFATCQNAGRLFVIFVPLVIRLIVFGIRRQNCT